MAIQRPVSTETPKERALLVGAPLKEVPSTVAREHLEELARLADTAGAEIVGELSQRLDSPHPKFYIGQGKAKELKAMAEELGGTVIIFDEELSPAQSKNLEKLLEIRVVDRTELILDIFATRARSSEAQMQVELAQLQYMLPRLKRLWTHLERYKGGIGMRGPGETQLETDRRLIGIRIRDLKQKLEIVTQRRATQRKSRASEFRIALVGYTNAGKSSVLKSLSGADILVEDRLFATLDPSTRVVEVEPGVRVLVTDTVGFIRKLPHHLVASFRSTLEETAEADVLLHVIDAAHPDWEEQKKVVEDVLGDLGVGDRLTLLVFNKIDQLTHEEEAALRLRIQGFFDEEFVFASAVEAGGLDELRKHVLSLHRLQRPEVHLSIPFADGDTLAAVYREGEVLRREDGEDAVELQVRLPIAALGRLQRRLGGSDTVGAA